MARTWLVTGCSRGLGRALAEAILDMGDNLLATARDPGMLGGMTAGRSGRIVTAPLDVTNEKQAAAAVNAAIAAFGALDILVTMPDLAISVRSKIRPLLLFGGK